MAYFVYTTVQNQKSLKDKQHILTLKKQFFCQENKLIKKEKKQMAFIFLWLINQLIIAALTHIESDLQSDPTLIIFCTMLQGLSPPFDPLQYSYGKDGFAKLFNLAKAKGTQGH